MRTDHGYLLIAKLRELARVNAILFDEFENARAGSNASHRKGLKILKIVPFGLCARSDYVNHPGGGYFSDLDLLVIVDYDELAAITEACVAAVPVGGEPLAVTERN